MFVLIEGADASGKTTTIQSLSDHVSANPEEFANKKLMHIKSPSGVFGPLARDINLNEDIDPLTKFYFFRAAIQHDTFNIKQALNSGCLVIGERYIYTTEAYHCTLDDLQPDSQNMSHHVNKDQTLKPDLMFMLDMPEETQIERLKRKWEEQTVWWEGLEFQQKFARKLRSICENEKMTVICTSKHAPDKVVNIIAQAIKSKLGRQ